MVLYPGMGTSYASATTCTKHTGIGAAGRVAFPYVEAAQARLEKSAATPRSQPAAAAAAAATAGTVGGKRPHLLGGRPLVTVQRAVEANPAGSGGSMWRKEVSRAKSRMAGGATRAAALVARRQPASAASERAGGEQADASGGGNRAAPSTAAELPFPCICMHACKGPGPLERKEESTAAHLNWVSGRRISQGFPASSQ